MNSNKTQKTTASEAAPVQPAANRRQFLSTAGAAAGAVAATSGVHTQVLGQNPQSPTEAVRIALVGAGGRGGGAVNNTLTINPNVELVAIADIDEEKPARLRDQMAKRYEKKVKITDQSLYTGLDAYKRILDDESVDLVIFTTPPGFRPQHVMDAVDAGKHVFAEKPTCVDPAGYRVCLKAHQKAIANKTAIVTGTQYRRQVNYVEAIRRLHAGEIGDIIGATSRYCSNGIWYRNRRDGMSDTEYQIYNWMHFIWLSGDQITEQAVHNIDLMNWLMQGPPESAFGGGGRFTRPEDSEMWDSMSIDYRYPGDRFISFKCRQIPGAKGETGTKIYGSEGTAQILGGNGGAWLKDKDGNEIWSMKGDIGAAYEQEHKDLVQSIRAGDPIVEFAETAASSLTAVMGRMAAYSGQYATWDFVTKESTLQLFPDEIDLSASRESSHAIPGKTKLV
ncbi:Gfo/Idh/MocA family protein [Crateriforma spongiae]|uniref:Gfo/Idh/MocA family protein n=1 Tax=Crateriforma spongiae TaxID=2724528 RepID=UPI0014461221|nr:Gfo/Idh/MocA family oxidoreductase [Crateriforma spongiae]